MSNDLLLPIVNEALEENDIKYEVLECDPSLADTAAFCEHYGYSLNQAANTILVMSKKISPVKYAVCINLATTKLDVNKSVRKLLDVKRISFADADSTTMLSEMLIGGVTPFGIKNLPIYVDSEVLNQKQVVMGGGNRSSKLILDPKELKKLDNVLIVEALALPK